MAADGTPVELPLAACALDTPGLQEQLGRYRAIGGSAVAIVREPRELRVRLGPEADLDLLREAVAVERACCPFLAVAVDDATRTLSIGVADPAMAPALDAIEQSLRG